MPRRYLKLTQAQLAEIWEREMASPQMSQRTARSAALLSVGGDGAAASGGGGEAAAVPELEIAVTPLVSLARTKGGIARRVIV